MQILEAAGTPLEARIFTWFWYVPDLGTNGSGIPEFGIFPQIIV